MNDLNELFNAQSFNDYIREAETNLPVGLKILETQGEALSHNEEKIQTSISCYGLKLENFPAIDGTNTLVTSESNSDSSRTTSPLPFHGNHNLFLIRPT